VAGAPAPASPAWKTRPGVRAVVVDDAGRILLLKRPATEAFWPGCWNLPGGALDAGETPLAGATRELKEETGLTAEYTGISMPFVFPGGHGDAYLYRDPRGAQAFPTREVCEAMWVYPNDLPSPLMPTTTEIVRGLVGSSERPMKDLELTTRRRRLEASASHLVAPWLRAMVIELAAGILGDRLSKSLTPDDPMYEHIQALFKRNEDEDRLATKERHQRLDTDGLGEAAFLKTLTRAVKLGRSEAARAILVDAKRGQLPHGRTRYREETLAGLQDIGRRHLRQIKATSERRLTAIALQPDAADVQTMLAKLYDTYRSDLIGRSLVAEGYIGGVADVLKDHGYNVVWARTMADEKVCPICKHFETTPELARMTIRQFLKRFPLHPHCFTAGHMVTTDQGLKPIEQVKPGDMVLTHKERYKKVLRNRAVPVKTQGYRITTIDGRVLTVTGEHPFLTQRGWVEARDLLTTDQLRAVEGEAHASHD
jgi:8-oxo-dGTP pyrophosphatase MutT (NUDIX family)